MTIVDEVLTLPSISARPPVLMDIGASGQLPREWQPLARHAVCIAFDADDRDFGAKVARSHPYRTLHLHNNIVSDKSDSELDFFLTRSPHCSSSLPPETEKLSRWIFADLFDVEKRIRLRSRRLVDILAEHELNYVDWFKTDSQGTDLRLFLSLGAPVVERVLAASFEPGIIDAYAGEDKLETLMAAMSGLPFWMHHMEVRGTQRLSRKIWEEQVRPRTNGAAPLALRRSPGWAEVFYLNTLERFDGFDQRDLLLAWVFATLNGQHGFALEVAMRAQTRFSELVFKRLADHSLDKTAGLADRVIPSSGKRALAVLRELKSRWLGTP